MPPTQSPSNDKVPQKFKSSNEAPQKHRLKHRKKADLIRERSKYITCWDFQRSYGPYDGCEKTWVFKVREWLEGIIFCARWVKRPKRQIKNSIGIISILFEFRLIIFNEYFHNFKYSPDIRRINLAANIILFAGRRSTFKTEFIVDSTVSTWWISTITYFLWECPSIYWKGRGNTIFVKINIIMLFF